MKVHKTITKIGKTFGRGMFYFLMIWVVLVILAHICPSSSFAKSGAVFENLEILGGVPVAIDGFYDTTSAETSIYSAFDTAHGIFKSSYNGVSWKDWKRVYDGDTLTDASGKVKHLVVNKSKGYILANTQDAVIRSQNGGETWEVVLNSTMDGNEYPYAETITTLSIDRSNYLYAGTSYVESQEKRCAIYKSTDNGSSWTQLKTFDPESSVGGKVNSILISDSKVYVVLLYTINGVSYGDLRQSPSYDSIGPNKSSLASKTNGSYSIVGCDPENKTVIYLGGESLLDTDKPNTPKIYYTEDSGNSWTEIASSSGFAGGPPRYFQFRDVDGKMNVFTSARYRISKADTTDTWSSAKGRENALLFDPRDSNGNIWYIQSNLGIKRSTDDGDKFTEFSGGLQACTIYDIAQKDSLVWVASSVGLFKNTQFKSDPKAWSSGMYPSTTGLPAYSVAIHPTNTSLIIAGMDKIYKTTNAGTSWTMVYDPSAMGTTEKWEITDIAFDTNNNTHVFATIRNSKGTKGEVVYSGTSGDSGTWSRIFTTNGGSNIPVNRIVISTNILVATGDAEKKQNGLGVYKNTGTGTTFAWQKKTGGGIENSVVTGLFVKPALATTIYAVGSKISSGTIVSSHIWRSLDDGETWSSLTTFSGFPRSITIRSDETSEMYVGADDKIYKTTDAGSSWVSYRTNIAGDTARVLHYDELIEGTDTGLYHYTKDSEDEDDDDTEIQCFVATVCLSSQRPESLQVKHTNGPNKHANEKRENGIEKSRPRLYLTRESASDLAALRRFRDEWLKKNSFGKWMVCQYEQYGPYWASLIRNQNCAKTSVKAILIKPLVLIARELEGDCYVLRLCLLSIASFFMVRFALLRF